MAKLLILLGIGALLALINGNTTTSPNETVEYRPLTECEEGRIRPDADANKFQQLTITINGTDEWLIRNCQNPDLLFKMEVCACVLPRQSKCGFRAIPGNDKRFQETISPYTNFSCSVKNTFWNQSACRCDWYTDGPQSPNLPDLSSCHAIFSTTFNNGDVGGLQKEPWGAVRITTVDGADGRALETEPAYNIISYKLAHTTFGAGFVVQLRFKSKVNPDVNDKFVALVSNGCTHQETVAISYRASDKIYEVSLAAFMLRERANNFMRFRCIDSSNVPDGFQWNKVLLAMTPGRISFSVNDVLCHEEDIPPARPHRPRCPLVIGGDRQTRNRKRPSLDGYVDEISFRRYCLRA